MKFNQQQKQNIMKIKHKKPIKHIPLELLVEIIKTATYPIDVQNQLTREYLEIKSGLKMEATAKMCKMQLFGKYWRNHIKNILTTSRIIYDIIGNKYTKGKVPLEDMMAHYLQAASNTDGTSSSSQTQNFNFLKRKLSGKLGFDDEGCSSKKNKDDSPAIGVPLIRLPESNFCPLCNTQTTRENWARHCHGRHKDFLENDQLVVREAEVRSFIFNCMEKLNFSAYHIFQFVTNMDFADKYGFYSHGLTNFGSFVTNLYEKNLVTSGATSILKEKGSTAYINGENMLGVVVANYCTDKAIVLARTYGTGMVVAKNSNNFGCGQYFIKNMARYGMEGFICSSDSSSLYVTTNNRLYEIPRTKITSEFITLLSLFAGDRLGDDLQGKEHCYFAKDPNCFSTQGSLLNRMSNDTFELSVEGEKEYEKKLSVLGGFRYSQDVLNNIINLAADFGVPNLNVV